MFFEIILGFGLLLDDDHCLILCVCVSGPFCVIWVGQEANIVLVFPRVGDLTESTTTLTDPDPIKSRPQVNSFPHSPPCSSSPMRDQQTRQRRDCLNPLRPLFPAEAVGVEGRPPSQAAPPSLPARAPVEHLFRAALLEGGKREGHPLMEFSSRVRHSHWLSRIP